MTFHLLGLSHLPWSREYNSCAFSQKNLKLAKMLTSLNHTVYAYGAKASLYMYSAESYVNSDKFHFIETHTVDDIARDWGDGRNDFEVGYNWTQEQYRHDFNTEKKPSTLKLYTVASQYINAHRKPDDFLLRTMGVYHDVVANATGLALDCESGIGYTGSEAGTPEHPRYRCFESSAMMHFSYGAEFGKGVTPTGNYYDRVIPNYFDDADFTPRYKKKDYFLFIGRLIVAKGIWIAVETARILGKKLIIVGQGAKVDNRGHLVGDGFDIPPSTWEFQGYADAEKRKELYANAAITFVPTWYIEPFGGTNVESRLSGTPVLCSNFGAFPEQVTNGLDGYCCDTLDDYVAKAKELLVWAPEKLKQVRKRAEKYLMDNVRWDYQKWFELRILLYRGDKYSFTTRRG